MKQKPKKFGLIIRICVSILLIGLLFKIMHWPFANALLLITISAILIFYSIRFILKTKKEILDYVKWFLVVSWSINFFANGLHLFYLPKILSFIPLLLFIWWFINDGTYYLTENRIKSGLNFKTFYYIFLLITFGLLIGGSIFKIMHWPYGSLMITLGTLLASFFLIIDYFARKEKTSSEN